jgi:pyruvate dehydrogenase (quinone)/pyruvate oxidase
MPGDVGAWDSSAEGLYDAALDGQPVLAITGMTYPSVENPAACGRILDQALATPGPVIIEALVDPYEPPMPAKATLEQPAYFAKALLRGDLNRERIALTVLSDKVRELT